MSLDRFWQQGGALGPKEGHGTDSLGLTALPGELWRFLPLAKADVVFFLVHFLEIGLGSKGKYWLLLTEFACGSFKGLLFS